MFDPKMGDPLKIEVYDVKSMQRDNVQDSQHYEYRRSLIFPSLADDSGKKSFDEIKGILTPYFASFDKPSVPAELVK